MSERVKTTKREIFELSVLERQVLAPKEMRSVVKLVTRAQLQAVAARAKARRAKGVDVV